MPGQVLPVVTRLDLDATRAHRLWNWLLARQGLAQNSRLPSVVSVADATLGLHAARLPTPFATAAARGITSAVPMRLLQAGGRQDLVTVRCMRKTLHALPPALAAAAHSATLHFRERDVLRTIANAGLTVRKVERAVDELLVLLSDGGRRGHRAIEDVLVGGGIDRVASRLALKLAWERGQVVYLNDTTRWDKEVRTFAIPGGGPLDRDRREATAAVVAAYVDRYGPVTLADATWWSGLSRTAVVVGLGMAGCELAQVTTPWSAEPQFMPRVRLEEFLGIDQSAYQTGINLLAHEDVALKAYKTTRQRYLGSVQAGRVFNSIGEVLPTVLDDGLVIGAWKWNRGARDVDCRFVRGMSSPELRRRVRARAAQLGAVLREGAGSPAAQQTDVTSQECYGVRSLPHLPSARCE